MAVAGLKPWREIVTPHKDVASGRYQQAEFAADLWQVHLGEGTDEYRDPVEFFRRTYLTESLKGLLVGAIHRLAGRGGDPVVQLQTNFGGGKTHSMLALYHLFSGTAPGELAGIDAVLPEAQATELETARRVVLVGNKISLGNPVTKADGTVVRTLWGELAWASILEEREPLDLSPHQVRQAEIQKEAAASAVTARLPEAYQWLLVLGQTRPDAPVEWLAMRLSGQGPLAARASRKLKGDELLVNGFAPTRLRMELDRVPLWRGDDVSVKQLAEDFARYLYLPRGSQGHGDSGDRGRGAVRCPRPRGPHRHGEQPDVEVHESGLRERIDRP